MEAFKHMAILTSCVGLGILFYGAKTLFAPNKDSRNEGIFGFSLMAFITCNAVALVLSVPYVSRIKSV